MENQSASGQGGAASRLRPASRGRRWAPSRPVEGHAVSVERRVVPAPAPAVSADSGGRRCGRGDGEPRPAHVSISIGRDLMELQFRNPTAGTRTFGAFVVTTRTDGLHLRRATACRDYSPGVIGPARLRI